MIDSRWSSVWGSQRAWAAVIGIAVLGGCTSVRVRLVVRGEMGRSTRLHVWTLTSGLHAMSVHAVLGENATHQSVLSNVQHCATHEFNIAHVTVQVESPGCESDCAS